MAWLLAAWLCGPTCISGIRRSSWASLTSQLHLCPEAAVTNPLFWKSPGYASPRPTLSLHLHKFISCNETVLPKRSRLEPETVSHPRWHGSLCVTARVTPGAVTLVRSPSRLPHLVSDPGSPTLFLLPGPSFLILGGRFSCFHLPHSGSLGSASHPRLPLGELVRLISQLPSPFWNCVAAAAPPTPRLLSTLGLSWTVSALASASGSALASPPGVAR